MEHMDMDMIGEGQDETQSVASENNNTNKKSMSGVWNFFEKIGKDINGIERAECNFCKNHFAIKQNPKSLKNYGTSHLMRHVISCKIILSKLNSLEQPFSMTEINQKTLVCI